MRHFLRTICLGGSTLAILAAAGCKHDDFQNPDSDNIPKICDRYCEKIENENPGFFQMVKRSKVNGQTVLSPMREILAVDSEGTLVTPYNASYGRNPKGDDLPTPNKSVGLDPACFAEQPYAVPDIASMDLTTSNTTITLVNMDRDGRLESRELNPSDRAFSVVSNILSSSNGSLTEYVEIQNALMDMERPTTTELYPNSSPVKRRDLNANNVPAEKTPFYKDLSNSSYKDAEGHVFFYVLLDEHLNFSRDVAALVTYAPETNRNLGTLYTPFVQYPVVPKTPNVRKLDVLTFHFIRDVSMSADNKEACRYVYDKHVISKGQAGFKPDTPLFIDPEVKTRGVVLDP